MIDNVHLSHASIVEGLQKKSIEKTFKKQTGVAQIQ